MTVAVLSREDVVAIVREAVRAELGVTKADEPEVLTREQAATLLQVHQNVLVRYVRTEGLPASKIGNVWRFKRSEILAWLEERAVRPGAHASKLGKKIRLAKGAA